MSSGHTWTLTSPIILEPGGAGAGGTGSPGAVSESVLAPDGTGASTGAVSESVLVPDGTGASTYAPPSNVIQVTEGQEIVLNGMKIPMVRDFSFERDHDHEGKAGRVTMTFEAEIWMEASEEAKSEEKAKAKTMKDETAKDFMKELKRL